ncbi:Uncharacterised protein [Raoultella ornithinolytica]|nr:Uncharacterised protein [Raoultella ornithinolytica]
MTTDITELAQREKFEAWFVNDVVGADVNFPAFKDGEYAEGEIYDEQLYFMLQAMWMAWKAANAELVEALEKAQQKIIELQQGCENDPRIHEIIDLQERIAELEFIRTSADQVQREFADELGCAGDNESILQAIDDLKIQSGTVLELKQAALADNAHLKLELEILPRTVKLPPELYTIGELIRTQDNRITDQPMFVVFQKREIIGSDEHSPSRICWVWDGEEVSELRAKRLEALYQDGRDTRGYDRYAMQEVDEFVTACFTEHGCKDYLRQNGHNLRLPYIYACGSFRNNEYQLVRNWLAGIKVEGE